MIHLTKKKLNDSIRISVPTLQKDPTAKLAQMWKLTQIRKSSKLENLFGSSFLYEFKLKCIINKALGKLL